MATFDSTWGDSKSWALGMAWHGSGELEDCKAECKELRQFAAEKAGKHSKMMEIM
jgi:hypothetical protein